MMVSSPQSQSRTTGPGTSSCSTAPVSGAIRRIRQACTYCRHRKTKCSGEKPFCNNCQRAGLFCQYKPFSQQPRTSRSLSTTSALQTSEATNPELLKRIKKIETQLAWISDQGLATDAQSSSTFAIDSSDHPRRYSVGAVDLDEISRHAFALPLEEASMPESATLGDSPSPQPLPPLSTSQPPSVTLPLDTTRFSRLPPPAVVQSLIDTYFLHVHNQPYSYFQEGNFRDKLRFGFLPKCLVFAVLASAMRFSNDAYFKGCKQEATEAYAREAWLSVLNDHMTAENCPNLSVAQTTNILAIIDFTAGRTSSGWLKIGLAVRIAQDLQLMKEPTGTMSVVEQEERRRSFWSIYLLDKLVSCGRSRPPAMYDEDCHVQLPCDENAFLRGEPQKTATIYKVANWTIDSDYVHGNFTLTILAASALGRCARYVLHQCEADEMAPWDQRSEFASINTYLQMVSHHLRVDSMSAADIIQSHQKTDGLVDYRDAGHMVFSYALFHLCYCLLNHPILLHLRLQKLHYRVPASFQTRCLITSTEHANMVIELLHDAAAAGCPIQASFYGYIVTLVGSIIMLAIQSKKQLGTITVSKLQENRKQALDILESMGNVWEHASKMHLQLLLFDASVLASTMNLDANVPADIGADIEKVLWPIVDYGLMCSRLGLDAETSESKSTPEWFDGSAYFTNMDLSDMVESTEDFSGFGVEADNLMTADTALPSIQCSAGGML